jgi:pre-rRNA-processing protein TSR1
VESKRALAKILEYRFPDSRLFPLDTEQDALLILRHLSAQRQRKLGFRSRRPHLVAQSVSYTPNTSAPGGAPATGLGTLHVSGYVRGCPLQVDRLVHLTGYGDFQLSQVDAPVDPLPLIFPTTRTAKPGKEGEVDMQVGGVGLFYYCRITHHMLHHMLNPGVTSVNLSLFRWVSSPPRLE